MSQFDVQPYDILLLLPTVADFEEIKSQLNKLGVNYKFRFAGSQEEFEAATRSRQWDLIFCSCNMPGYDIADALTRLHEISNLSPVLVLSNDPSDEEAERVFNLGSWDYVVMQGMAGLPWKAKFLMQNARFQERLKTAESKYGHLFEDVLDGVLLVDHKGTILKANFELLKQFGYVKSQLEGTNVNRLVPKEYLDAHEALFERSFEGSGTREVNSRREVSGLRHDGTTFPIDVQVRSMPEPDSHLTIARIRDISDRKNLELNVSRSERLDALGTFAGSIVHDLNNALAPVILCLELLRNNCPSSHELVDTAEGGAFRARDLLRELLTYSKGSRVEPELIPSKALLDTFIRLIDRLISNKVSLQTSFDSSLGNFWGDPIQITQVLVNLAQNALDAMHEGGELQIRAEEIELTPKNTFEIPDPVFGRYLKITFADNGEGIHRENMTKIFEPFFTTKKHDKGTGLGLAIVTDIIRSHHGYLTVKSEQAVGSTFTVFFPAAFSSNGSDQQPQTQAQVKVEHPLVLLVDDDESVRSSLHMALMSLHYSVLVARDGAEAIRLAKANHDKLGWVITDLMMPLMNGIELTKALKTEWPKIEVIAMSGNFEPEIVADLKALGVKIFLQKPLSLDLIADALSSGDTVLESSS